MHINTARAITCGSGSARVSRVGFGVSPKQSSRESPRWRDVIANTRDACATRSAAARS